MNHIKKNIQYAQKIIQKINPQAHLLVATKYASIEETQAVIDSGIHLLGENKVQDAEKKITVIKNPKISWHLLGHLQSNKVNKAVTLFDCIQSVDSLKLAEKINAAAFALKKTQNVLIQINIGNEDQKSGFSKETYIQNINSLFTLHNIKILGIMVIVPHVKSEQELRSYFRQTKEVFEITKKSHPDLTLLSMGMSEDFEIALEEGSTLVRIGRSIFKN